MRKETIQIRSESRNTIKHIKDPEYKLEYVLTMLGLSQLFQTFLSSTITFIELIQMTKNDLFKLNLELYQRNRLFNFIQCYKKTETNDSFEELLKFFTNHKQFVFYNKLKQSNYEKGCLLTAKFFNEENVRKKIDVFQDINSNKGDNKNNHSNMNNNNNEIDNEEMNIEDYWHSESKMNKSNYNDCNNNCGNIDKTTSLKLFVNNSNKQKYKYDYFKRMKTRSSVSSSYMFNDSIYKSYLNINNSTDKIIEKLKKSKKERQLKYAKFHLLLNKSGIKTTLHHYHQQQLSKFNIRSESSQYENENGNNEMVYSINNSRSSEIDLLTTIINRKKQLQNALNKCNNSIYENRKVLIINLIDLIIK